MRARGWVMMAAVGLLLGACGDDGEAEGEVRPEPAPETEDPGADEPGSEATAGAGETETPTEVGDAEGASAVVEDDAFELRAASAGPYQSGELAQFAITLTPRGEWHVNEEFPISVELSGPSGVGFAKSQLERGDAAEFGEERARFDVPFTPSEAGQHRVEANVSFAVCTPENCIPDERTLAVLLPVE